MARALVSTSAAVLVTLVGATARAQEPAPPEKHGLELAPFGWIETAFSWNFNRPSNGITAYRGFDNRHSTFVIQNAVLGANASQGPFSARVALQVGTMPAAYVGNNEPVHPGGGTVAPSDGTYWRYLQEAFVSYDTGLGRGLRLQLGLYTSPIGYESVAVKDNWHWSHGNLFFGLPYYHTGLRASYPVTDTVTVNAAVVNGWNSIVDNNEAKSVESSVEYKGEHVQLEALYFGGVERASGAPEGPWWRHLFDVNAKVDATSFLSFIGEANYGIEPNRFGAARWWAGALHARASLVDKVRFAVRADHFHEDLATGVRGASSPIFWGGAAWVESGTATLEVQPHDHVVVRLDGRHDIAEAPLFFGRNVAGDGSAAAPFVANARTQTTVTLGATAWF